MLPSSFEVVRAQTALRPTAGRYLLLTALMAWGVTSFAAEAARAQVCPTSDGAKDRGRPLVNEAPVSKLPPLGLPGDAATRSIAELGAMLFNQAQGLHLRPESTIEGMPAIAVKLVELGTAGRWQQDCLDALANLRTSSAEFAAVWPKVAARQQEVHAGVLAAANLPTDEAIAALRQLVDWTQPAASARSGAWERGVVDPRDAETEALLALLGIARDQKRFDLFSDVASGLATRRTAIFDEASERLLWVHYQSRLVASREWARSEYGVFLAELDARLETARTGFYYQLKGLRLVPGEGGDVFGVGRVDLTHLPALKVGQLVAAPLGFDAKGVSSKTTLNWHFQEQHDEVIDCETTHEVCSISWDTGHFNYCEKCRYRTVKGTPTSARIELAMPIPTWAQVPATLLVVGEVAKPGPAYKVQNAALVKYPDAKKLWCRKANASYAPDCGWE